MIPDLPALRQTFGPFAKSRSNGAQTCSPNASDVTGGSSAAQRGFTKFTKSLKAENRQPLAEMPPEREIASLALQADQLSYRMELAEACQYY